MKLKKKLSALLCLSTILSGINVSKANNRYSFSDGLSSIPEETSLYFGDKYDDNDSEDRIGESVNANVSINNIKILLLLFLGLPDVFWLTLENEKKDSKSPNNVCDSNVRNERKNPGLFSKTKSVMIDKCEETEAGNLLLNKMNLSNELKLRGNPENYFEKIENNIYLKNQVNKKFNCGKFSCPSLKEIVDEAKAVKVEKKGKLDIIYASADNYDKIEIAKLIDSGYFDLVVPASNFNAIETLGLSDGDKKFSHYLIDFTQGPDCMEKFPCTSLTLLHIFNGKNMNVAKKFVPDCIGLIEQKSDQCELNLLKPYGIKTSNGYVMNGNLPKDFTNEENDLKYRVAYVEDAPVWYEGGFRYYPVVPGLRDHAKRIMNNEDRNFVFCENPKKINIFIDACIPHETSGYIGTNEKNIKAHLRRHYKMLINLCKAKKIKRVVFPLSGSGVFCVPAEWHYEILSDMKDLIEDSGTHFVLNAFNFNNIPHKEPFSFTEIKSEEDLQNLISNF